MLLDHRTITGFLYSGYTRQYTWNDAEKLSSLIDLLKQRWNRLYKKFQK